MAIAFGTATYGVGSFSATITQSADFGSSSDRGCIVWVWVNGNGGATTVSSATCDGIAMTADTQRAGDTGNFATGNMRAFRLASGSIGTGSRTIVVTLSDAGANSRCWILPISGVSAIGASVQGASTTGTPTLTVTGSSSGDTAVMFAAQYGVDSTWGQGTGTSLHHVVLNSECAYINGPIWYETSAGSTVDIGGTVSPGYWSMREGWNLTPAGGAAATSDPIINRGRRLVALTHL
jgi:hypothetical protein